MALKAIGITLVSLVGYRLIRDIRWQRGGRRLLGNLPGLPL